MGFFHITFPSEDSRRNMGGGRWGGGDGDGGGVYLQPHPCKN